MPQDFIRNGKRKVLALVAMAALGLTACGSPSTANPSGSGSASGGAQAEVAAAKAFIAKYSSPPTKITVTAPLTSAPKPGQTMVFLKCEVGSCAPLSTAMQAAVTAVGWTYKVINYTSADPASLANGLMQALRYKPAAVALSGIAPQQGYASVLPAYKAAGVPIIVSYVAGVKIENPIIADIAGASNNILNGRLMADWFIANSNAAGTVVLQRVDSFPILKTYADSFAETVKAGCAACTVINLRNTIPDVSSGAIITSSVSTLRSHPAAKYLVTADSEFLVGIDSAFAAAGLTGKVKVAGGVSTSGQLQSLKNSTGSVAALTQLPLDYSSWQMVDVALRHSEGMKFPTDGGGLPTQLLLPGGDFSVGNSYNQPADFEQQFKKLWHV